MASTTTRKGWLTTTETRRYDGDGMLVGYDTRRCGQTARTDLTWDTTGALPELLATAAGSSSRSFVNGRQGPLGVVRSNGSSAVLAKDALGSVTSTLLTADVVKAHAYDPFGEPDLGISLSDLTLTPAIGYRGEVTLGDSVYLVERAYDTGTGQMLTADPITQPAGSPTATNEYAYAANDPLNLIDPLGLSPISDASLASFGMSAVIGAATVSPPDISEWSLRHRAVQPHFMTVVRPGTRWEVFIPGGGLAGGDGRADLVFLTKVWEVKTASWHANGALKKTALRQLSTYIRYFPGGGGEVGDSYSMYTVPYPPGQLVVKSHENPGMLWYYYRQQTSPVPVPVPVPAPFPFPVPVPVPAPAPAPATESPATGWRPPGWLVPVAGGVAIVGGVLLIVGTVAEDFATAGVGIADDPVTIGAGSGMVAWGWGLFGLGAAAAGS